ncbi:MAG TPA: nickel ABC transporter permease [Thermomicrobiales bacterium]|nr:nickel ABC transporter permease [Thermomicrobiales bacterium]
MLRFVIRRLILLVPVIAIVGTIVFVLIHLTPGDPAVVVLGQDANPEQIEAMRERLGLNEPLYVQYFDWFLGAIRLDFGESIFLGQPVTESLLDRAQPTLLLTFYALTIQVLIAIPFGVISAVKHNSLLDRILMVISISGAAIPSFFLGIMLILFFAVQLQWLPSGGYTSITEDPVQHFKQMILPAFALGFTSAGLLARLVRSSMLDVLQEDFIRTAKAKGLPQRVLVVRHALRNALIPAITVIGYSLGGLLGGAVVTETVFTIPGMGRLVVQSVARRDFPVIQGAIVLIAAFYVLANLLVDVLYVYIDPRVRYGND